MWWKILVLPFFLLLNNIPLYVQPFAYLFLS